jgi:hypothetical protein
MQLLYVSDKMWSLAHSIKAVALSSHVRIVTLILYLMREVGSAGYTAGTTYCTEQLLLSLSCRYKSTQTQLHLLYKC